MIRLMPLALASCLLAAGCSTESTSSVSPTGASAVLDALAGAWTTSSSSGSLPTGCTQLDYTVTKGADGTSGVIQFSGICAGVEGSGSGQGTLTGTTLNWTAEGTATKSAITCPFKFTQGTAALEGTGIRVTYAGTVCGFPVSGSELLQRK